MVPRRRTRRGRDGGGEGRRREGGDRVVSLEPRVLFLACMLVNLVVVVVDGHGLMNHLGGKLVNKEDDDDDDDDEEEEEEEEEEKEEESKRNKEMKQRRGDGTEEEGAKGEEEGATEKGQTSSEKLARASMPTTRF